MYVLVGLGNPGSAYRGTRHNVGFGVIQELSDRHRIHADLKKHRGLIGKGMIDRQKVLFVMPQTYMNLSGECVREVLEYYKLGPENLIVFFDDISLDVGRIRIRAKGSAGGHNGVKSIIAQLGTNEFWRVKIGIGEKPPRMDLADYVLGRFPEEELEPVRQGIKAAADAAETLITEGIEKAMNQFNQSKRKAESIS